MTARMADALPCRRHTFKSSFASATPAAGRPRERSGQTGSSVSGQVRRVRADAVSYAARIAEAGLLCSKAGGFRERNSAGTRPRCLSPITRRPRGRSSAANPERVSIYRRSREFPHASPRAREPDGWRTTRLLAASEFLSASFRRLSSDPRRCRLSRGRLCRGNRSLHASEKRKPASARGGRRCS